MIDNLVIPNVLCGWIFVNKCKKNYFFFKNPLSAVVKFFFVCYTILGIVCFG